MLSYKLMMVLIALICSNALGSDTITIDPFEYDQSSTAQRTWKPQAGSSAVDITHGRTGQGKRALLLKCDFSQVEERCYWDREVALDLAKFGRFSIWINPENPQAVRNGTIYFQSGAGWFNGGFLVEKAGWQKVSLWKSDFRIEGSPAGWDSIKKIRISFWKSDDIDAAVAVDDLEAAADDITHCPGRYFHTQ